MYIGKVTYINEEKRISWTGRYILKIFFLTFELIVRLTIVLLLFDRLLEQDVGIETKILANILLQLGFLNEQLEFE